MPSSCLYAGLAGDTDPGRFISAGLFRSFDGAAPWESISQPFDARPQVRAIATDPRRPGRVTIGTEAGIFRSDDYGDHWQPMPAPKPGVAVWSLLLHPLQPDAMLAGYEPCAICRTSDGGRNWDALPVDVRFPDITLHPDDQPKRTTGIAIDPVQASEIYASIEIGGLIRSLDGGASWACMTEGLYLHEDAVDLHDVVVNAGVVTVAARIGVFRSIDRGEHWCSLPVPLLRDRGTYCRAVVIAPDRPTTLYVGAGNDFDGDKGALLQSRDDGRSWTALDLGMALKSTIFAIAIDANRPERIYCTTKYGHVFRSVDEGRHWNVNPLPAGAGHVFALAIGP